MKCLKPVVIENKKYRSLKPYFPNMTRYMLVPCNSCVNCKRNLINTWSLRLSYEAFCSDTSFFVTLTYDDDHLPADGVCKKDLQLFHYRLRTAGFKFRYYCISEYGPETHRPHYHGIYFGLPFHAFDMWPNGFVDVEEVIPQRINYVASYHILKNENVPEHKNPNFRLCSNKIGLDYFVQYEYSNYRLNDYKFLYDYDGNKLCVPRYFRKYSNAPKEYLSVDSNVYKNLSRLKEYYKVIDINYREFLNRKLKLKQL